MLHKPHSSKHHKFLRIREDHNIIINAFLSYGNWSSLNASLERRYFLNLCSAVEISIRQALAEVLREHGFL